MEKVLESLEVAMSEALGDGAPSLDGNRGGDKYKSPTAASPAALAAARKQVETLLSAGDLDKLVPKLSAMVDKFADHPGFLGYASDVFFGLSATPDGGRSRDLVQAAWATTLCAVIPGASSDEEGVAFINRLEVQFAAGNAYDPDIGYYQEFETGLKKFAKAGPRSALAASDLLSSSNPGLALELAEEADASLGQALVLASCHSALGEQEAAAEQFDRMERLWHHGPFLLHLDDRFQWVEAMTEVGRLAEAERVCKQTLEILKVRRAGNAGIDGEDLENDATGHWAHVYEVMAGRISHLQGRFAEGWDHLRAASDDDAQVPELRRSALRLRLMLSDKPLAVAALRDLERLAAEQDNDDAQATFADAALWASGQWGIEANSTIRSLDEPLDPDDRYLSTARLRGQVAARSLLVREGKKLDLGQRLRLALLAGDDRTAEKILEKNPLGKNDPWALRVLAAVLLLRLGKDADAADLLAKVLSTRRHQLDLRILHAQAVLLGDDHEAALAEAIACTEIMPQHLLARVVKAECSFEGAIASRSDDSSPESAENAQQLIQAVADYRMAADLHVSTRHYLVTGRANGPVGSEPLSPRMFEEVCRRGLHAAIMAQEEIDRLQLTRDRRLRRDAAALLDHLRRSSRACCGRDRGRLGHLVHRMKHSFDQDEPARLASLLSAHQQYVWASRAQSMAMVLIGLTICWVGFADLLPGPPSDTIRTTVVALGIILLMMPFARSLRIGAVEFQRPEAPRPEFGRSKALRTTSLMQRGYHLGSFALPSAPKKERSRREVVEAQVSG